MKLYNYMFNIWFITFYSITDRHFFFIQWATCCTFFSDLFFAHAFSIEHFSEWWRLLPSSRWLQFKLGSLTRETNKKNVRRSVMTLVRAKIWYDMTWHQIVVTFIHDVSLPKFDIMTWFNSCHYQSLRMSGDFSTYTGKWTID